MFTHHRRPLAIAFALAAIFPLATSFAADACLEWFLVGQNGSPGQRANHAMVYDPVRQAVVMLGGNLEEPSWNWVWDGASWHTDGLAPMGSANSTAMSYDSTRQRIVYIQSTSGPNDGTWEWDHVQWTHVLNNQPTNIDFAGIAFDPFKDSTFKFGGINYEHDTLEWNGINGWGTVLMSLSPPGRYAHAMAYHHDEHRVLIYGGRGPLDRLSDTWVFRNYQWSLVATGTPSKRRGPVMTYDSFRDIMVMFGGRDEPGVVFGETWEWIGSAWRDREVSGPTPRSAAAMAYDRRRNRIVLYGGVANGGQILDDTWELRASFPSDVNCDGTINPFDIAPFIDALGSSPPTPCSPCAGDANGNGTVNPFDIGPFLVCLNS